MESEPEFRHYVIATMKSRYFFLIVSGACLLCWVLSEELINYGLIASGLEPDWRKDLGHVLSWMLLPAVALFPLGICFSTRKLLLAEKWLLLFLVSLIIASVFFFGYQNPYIDSPFYHRPVLRFLDEICATFMVGAIFLGIAISFLHFFTREKECKPSLRRRIISNSTAILLIAVMLVISDYLSDMIC